MRAVFLEKLLIICHETGFGRWTESFLGEQDLTPVSPGKINAGQTTCETNAFSLIYIIADCACGPRSCAFRNRYQSPSCLCSSFLFPEPEIMVPASLEQEGQPQSWKEPFFRALNHGRSESRQIGVQIPPLALPNSTSLDR